METKDKEDVKVIRIFVNTANDYQIWDLDESFTNYIIQLINDRRDGIISQEEEHSQIYEILKLHGECIVKDIDFGIKVEADEENNDNSICISKENDEVISKLIDNVTNPNPIKKQKPKKKINKLSVLTSLIIISITICYVYIGK